MHEDELDVPVKVVEALVREQLPHMGDLPVTRVVSEGTVNAIFRVGDGLSARFPLRYQDPREARQWLQREASAADELAGVSPVPVPRPVHLGEPGHGYPMPWSVQTWLTGTPATVADPADSHEFAHDFAAFLIALRAADVKGRRFSGAGRGGRLPDHDDWMAVCFANSEHLLDVPRLRKLWQRLRLLPAAGQDVMSHTDLTPGNVLVQGGRLTGILDGGGFAPADPSLDLVGAWHLLNAGPRITLRDILRCTEVEWERGKAWAFIQAMGLVWYYEQSNQAMRSLGQRTLTRILADA